MIKRFKLFESEEVELIEKGDFTIDALMHRIENQENRIEFLTIFLDRTLKDQYVSFIEKGGKEVNKVIIKEAHILLNASKEERDTVLVNVFLIDENKITYGLHSDAKVTVFRIAGKTVITAEDPYGEEEWLY